jgi:hypothetical protein
MMLCFVVLLSGAILLLLMLNRRGMFAGIPRSIAGGD